MKTATEARPFCASIHPDYKQRRITEVQEQLFDVLNNKVEVTIFPRGTWFLIIVGLGIG